MASSDDLWQQPHLLLGLQVEVPLERYRISLAQCSFVASCSGAVREPDEVESRIRIVQFAKLGS